MAVELEELYEAIQPLYEVKLVTESCFKKRIEWTHIIENPDFTRLLHGNELVFSAALQYTSEEWLFDFVKRLIQANAGGLIISTKKEAKISPRIIAYCNEQHFPLFDSDWDTPYLDIMRMFAEILLRNEQRDTTLATALKNAIYFPGNEEAYLPHFERNGFFRNMQYMMVVLSCNRYRTENGNPRLMELAKKIQYSKYKCIVAEEGARLFVMVAGEDKNTVKQELTKICQKDKGVYVGIGEVVTGLRSLRDSYEQAVSAYQLTNTAIASNILVYEELGVYKILADLRHPELGEAFVEEVLGPLIKYDQENHTEYLGILKEFFKNDCNILRTSEAIFCHKNTLNYKMNAIKKIMNCDIMSNENRTRIMVALYFVSMRR
ncbi:MAG: PucR family transcriptional regulator ligand-binding domain-containing protein [Lachnospiraceae bacterium]|nr:PucR family transcriptional regulator ligand-binding domain-containing protein [Lachnospiraceae bacterium]